MFAPAGRITARAGLRSKLAAIVLAAKRAVSQQRDFFASFLVTKKVDLTERCRYKRPCRKVGRAGRAQHKDISREVQSTAGRR